MMTISQINRDNTRIFKCKVKEYNFDLITQFCFQRIMMYFHRQNCKDGLFIRLSEDYMLG